MAERKFNVVFLAIIIIGIFFLFIKPNLLDSDTGDVDVPCGDNHPCATGYVCDNGECIPEEALMDINVQR